jgi:hypothetical protein
MGWVDARREGCSSGTGPSDPAAMGPRAACNGPGMVQPASDEQRAAASSATMAPRRARDRNKTAPGDEHERRALGGHVNWLCALCFVLFLYI